MFCPSRARWVAQETWHVGQQGWFGDDGSHHLKVPYSAPTELVMDILKRLPEVRLVSPASLREMVVEKIRAALDSL